MTDKQRQELATLEAKDQLTDKEFDRYEYLNTLFPCLCR